MCCQSRRRFLVSPYFLPFHPPPPPFSSPKIAAAGVESLARVKSAGRTMESDYVDGKRRRSVGLGTKTIAVFQGWNPVLPHTLSVSHSRPNIPRKIVRSSKSIIGRKTRKGGSWSIRIKTSISFYARNDRLGISCYSSSS